MARQLYGGVRRVPPQVQLRQRDRRRRFVTFQVLLPDYQTVIHIQLQFVGLAPIPSMLPLLADTVAAVGLVSFFRRLLRSWQGDLVQ